MAHCFWNLRDASIPLTVSLADVLACSEPCKASFNTKVQMYRISKVPVSDTSPYVLQVPLHATAPRTVSVNICQTHRPVITGDLRYIFET